MLLMNRIRKHRQTFAVISDQFTGADCLRAMGTTATTETGLNENLRLLQLGHTQTRTEALALTADCYGYGSCHIFLLSQLTTLTIHNSLSLSLPAQDLPFHKSFPP